MGKKWLSQSQIWDDSALQNSWNAAEAEYKKYYSIHTQGGDVEKLLQQIEADEEKEAGEVEEVEGVDMDASVELPEVEDRNVSIENLDTGSHPNAVAHGDQRVDAKAGAETSEAMMITRQIMFRMLEELHQHIKVQVNCPCQHGFLLQVRE
ncbi:MAG: hypothetical protein Q9165_000604 [Trypethelium subeluteriae]